MLRYTTDRNNAWVTSCAGPGTMVSACGRYAASRGPEGWTIREIHNPNKPYAVVVANLTEALEWLTRAGRAGTMAALVQADTLTTRLFVRWFADTTARTPEFLAMNAGEAWGVYTS